MLFFNVRAYYSSLDSNTIAHGAEIDIVMTQIVLTKCILIVSLVSHLKSSTGRIKMVKEILTEKEAAFYIGMSRSFLSQDRMNGYRVNRTPGPTFLKLGRSIRYRKEDLDNWLNEHRQVRTAV